MSDDNCTCGNIKIGNTVTELKNIDQLCLIHGFGTEYFNKIREKHKLHPVIRVENVDKTNLIHFQTENDIEFGDKLKWSIFGDIKTDEIIVSAEAPNKTISYKIKSNLIYPRMIDRIFGIDQSDVKLAFWLSDLLYLKHKKELTE